MRAHCSLTVNDHEAAKIVLLLCPWLSSQNVQECSRRENSDPPVFTQLEEVLITAYDTVSLPFNRTFWVAVIRWILCDHFEVNRTWRHDREMGKILKKALKLLFGPAVALAILG